MELYLYYIRRIKPNYRRIKQKWQEDQAGGPARRIKLGIRHDDQEKFGKAN
jgi:hypothetical protein